MIIRTLAPSGFYHSIWVSLLLNPPRVSRFFNNKGAVAGVFLIVGLAAATICLWIFFFVRRRRRTRRLEHDTAVSATLAAVGFNRTPLVDDDDDDEEAGRGALRHRGGSGSLQMAQRSGNLSLPTDDELGVGRGFDPYVPYGPVAGSGPASQGYIPARTASPPPGPGAGHYPQDSVGSADRASGHSPSGHIPRYSAGSYEPLLANMSSQASPTTPGSADDGEPRAPTPPPRNPLRNSAGPKQTTEEGEVSGEPDARLRGGTGSGDEPRDDVDYSRPVLEVRPLRSSN